MGNVKCDSYKRFGRRRFPGNMSALGAASFLGLPRAAVAEPPPETTKIRLVHLPTICLAPQYLAEEFPRMEGFAEVEYVKNRTTKSYEVLDEGRADFTQNTAVDLLPNIEAGKPLVALSGVHTGCYELVATERIKSIRDLVGSRVAVSALGSPEHHLLASMLAYLGIDPRKDVKWVTNTKDKHSIGLFAEGKADAIMAFAPQQYELRAKKIGHTVVNTALDRPWSQYYCCLFVGHKEFVAKYPVATKRALRAFLKATDLCANDPQRAAQMLVSRGFEPRLEIGLDALKTLPYRRWREVHPEDTLRFYGLRLHEVGMIKANPQKLIAQGTDWRFLDGLRTELYMQRTGQQRRFAPRDG